MKENYTRLERTDKSALSIVYAFGVANRLTAVSSNGVGVASFAYDAKSRRVRKTTPAATHTYFYDHNGNIVRYVSEDGALSAAYEYDPFGNVLSAPKSLSAGEWPENPCE